MERFLSQCARYIFEKHATELKDICLVFPNRRSGVFFNSYLRKQLSHAVIGPKVTTVNELISGYSDLHQGEKLQLISLLFEVFRKYTQTAEAFDDFYFWGEVLLADFNDIDRYLVDGKDLFTNIADIKEIEGLFDYLTPEQKEALANFWGSLAIPEHKANHEKFLFIWNKLFPVYRDFTAELEKQGMAYRGMIYRTVVNALKNNQLAFPFSKYYIVGLNALDSCETVFFEYLNRRGKAVFLWDYDRFYLDDIKNEAGRFMRDNLRRFPPPGDFFGETDAFSKKKKVRFTAISSNYGQAQEIPRFLQETSFSFKNEFDNTAIVLADESLLFPALGAIPGDFGTVNITMGYPVKNSVVYGFLLLLINLLKNRRLNDENKTVVYHRFVTDVLNHPLLVNMEPQKTKSYLDEIKRVNQIAIPLDKIDFSPLHRFVFSLPAKVEDYCDYFLEILSRLNGMIKEKDPGNPLIPELIHSIYQAVEKMSTVIQQVQKEQRRSISEAVFFRLFHQYMSQVSVAFEGEPLSGMQVMGILETRCLDFKNLIILGLNENKWPRTFTAPSFIPFNIRKGFGLPGIDEQDAMYAYYFYRLIQRADAVTATYSTLKEGISTGELSRYGYQLLYDSNLNPQPGNLFFQFSNDPVPAITVEGVSGKQRMLLERNTPENPLSPTAVNTFLLCSLRFYFRYILQLPEPDEMKDEIDSPVFGNIFHETIESLYRPYIGKTVSKNSLEEIRKNRVLIENEIRKAIAKHYFKQPASSGKPVKLEGKTVLIFENTKTFLQRLLEIDIRMAPFELVSLENSYTAKWMVEINGNPAPVYIGGKIDRVDKVNGIHRVLDYKTGNVESLSFKHLDELFEKNLEKPKKEILQALIYSMVLKENLGDVHNYQPAIYSLRKLFVENFTSEVKYNGSAFVFQDVEEHFIGCLNRLVGEIFSNGTSFYQTPHEKICQYCPYAKICLRY